MPAELLPKAKAGVVAVLAAVLMAGCGSEPNAKLGVLLEGAAAAVGGAELLGLKEKAGAADAGAAGCGLVPNEKVNAGALLADGAAVLLPPVPTNGAEAGSDTEAGGARAGADMNWDDVLAGAACFKSDPMPVLEAGMGAAG